MGKPALCLVLLAACSSYEPFPLDERSVLDALRTASIEVPADGFDQDQAVAMALVNHPDLQVWRRNHEIASGLVLSESAWANPEFRPSLQNLYSRLGNPLTFALDLRLFPAMPGETEAKVARSKARERRVLAEIEDLEKRLAADTRIAHARLVMLDIRLALAGRAARLHERLEAMVVQRVEAGAATEVDRALVMLQREKIDNEIQSLTAERASAQARLAELVGGHPELEIRVQGRKERRAAPELSQERLEDLALAERSDLRALKQAYEEREHQLELIHLAHGFWPRFLQAGLGGLTKGTSVGLDAAVEIPLFDSGESEIAVAELRRTQARDAYRTRLHAVRAEIRQATLDFREQERRERFVSDRLEPVLQQAEMLFRAALEADAVDPLKLVAMEMQVMDARREAAQSEFEHERARVRLASVTGTIFLQP